MDEAFRADQMELEILDDIGQLKYSLQDYEAITCNRFMDEVHKNLLDLCNFTLKYITKNISNPSRGRWDNN